MTFKELNLSAPLLRAVQEAGYETPSPIQAAAIPPVLAGRDLMGCAQTGTGKTAAFALPMLDRLTANAPRRKGAVRALILTPTRELALQIGESFEAYGKYLKLRSLITPFKEDESVDYDALMRMVDYLLQNNADFLCVLGTTAETPTLTEEEKKTIKKMVIDRVNGRIPILLGVGGNNTRAIVETLKNDNFTGVDAILSVVPYYNKPSQEGIYQHYKAIAEATELPIVLYNVPGRTGVNMTAETTLRIARDFNNVVAIKDFELRSQYGYWI